MEKVLPGYAEALQLAGAHYENFPVVSMFVPAKLRKDVAIIYWFARTADDIADEGSAPPQAREEALNRFLERFEDSLKGNYHSELDEALANTIYTRNLDSQMFRNLISAFRQDISVTRYDKFANILDYCSRSANPVGRLILQLHDIRDEKYYDYSDKICTALQLINFYQDLSVDFKRNRLYIPIEEILSYGIDPKILVLSSEQLNVSELIRSQIDRAEAIMMDGRPLIGLLNGRLRIQISATFYGGLSILEKIRLGGYNSHLIRPALSKFDYFYLFIRSIF